MTTTRAGTVGGRIDDAAVRDLRDRVRGDLLTPGDPGYDDARTVWNATVDRHPALILRCRGAEDVAAAVDFARNAGLPLSIKGGGHNVAGRAVCDGGLVADLSPMKRVRVDAGQRTATVEPGVLWDELDRETHRHGLATVGGVVGSTGVAGLTLGGGQGWLTGKFGLSIDNLLAVRVVTADGRQLPASDHENADLFWAMRGAGANFGVAVSFDFRLHQVSIVLGGLVAHPIDRARDVLRFYREFAATQPDDLTTYAVVLTLPDGPPVVALVACHAGNPVAGELALAPLRGFGQPLADTFAPMPYLAMQGLIGPGFPHGRRNYWKSGMTADIADETIAAVADFGRRMPSPHTAIVFADCHGAYAHAASADSAYPHRDMRFDFEVLSSWADADETDANVRWTRELFAAVEPHLGRGVYVNGLDQDDGQERARRAYGANYDRLASLKGRYDPTNLFRQNTNIPPAVAPTQDGSTG